MTKYIRLFALALLCSVTVQAQQVITVDKGISPTVKGVAGNLELTYAFASGDKVTIRAHAAKELEEMRVIMYPEKQLDVIKKTKNINYTFTMKQAGFVTFRFISDRGGTDNIKYAITRIPASRTTSGYVTRVKWEKPANKVGLPVPHQAGN